LAKKAVSKKRPAQDQTVNVGPSTILTPDEFSKWMTYAVSKDFLNPKRKALLKKIGDNLSRDPALLKNIELILRDYGDEIHRISPTQKELEKYNFGWFIGKEAQTLVPPAAAAAALAPAAAALAAAHQGGSEE
jgi:hypothetical protein